jgi:hypothetical protein
LDLIGWAVHNVTIPNSFIATNLISRTFIEAVEKAAAEVNNRYCSEQSESES